MPRSSQTALDDAAFPPAAQTTSIGTQTYSRIECAAALAFGVTLGGAAILLDLPRPAVDDLMFTGAAFEIAHTGELRNSLLVDQFGTDVFLVYPPFYAWLLGGWLRLFGISTGALLVFQHLCYLIAGSSLAIWLGRRASLGRPRWLWPALFAVGLLSSIGTMGLRPEAAGFAALMLGLCLRETGRSTSHVLGWVLIGSSMGIAPHMLPYAIALTVIAQCWPLPERATPLTQWRIVGSAAVVVVALFLWSTGGRMSEFFVALTSHASRTSLALGDAFAVAWTRASSNLFGQTFFFVGAATFALALFATRISTWRRFLLATAVVALAGIVSAVLDVARDELRLFTLFMWSFAVLAWLSARPSRVARIARFGVLVFLAALCWEQRRNWPLLGSAGKPSSDSVSAAQRALENNPRSKLLIDSHAARYLFDYRIPPNTRDWIFSRPFPRMWPESLADRSPEEVWIVALERIWMIEPQRAPQLQPVFTAFGRSLLRRPGEQDFAVIDHPTRQP